MLLRSGLVRGLVGQLVGTLAGMATVVALRLALGRPGWAAEPATVVGVLVGVAGFMIAAGTVSDWWQWAKGHDTPLRHGAP
ncbi:MAG: cytochrome C oxidase subunit I, partial [Anaerolineae bacterium]